MTNNDPLAGLLKFKVGTKLPSPYLWFYATGEQLGLEARKLEEGDRALFEVLEGFIQASMGEEYARVKSLLSKGLTTWKYLDYLFVGSSTKSWS